MYLLSPAHILNHSSEEEIRKYFELIMKTQHNKTYGVLLPLCFLISYCWCLKNVLVSVHLF
jgi:hypothetical protein